jgi:hypothetical protein
MDKERLRQVARKFEIETEYDSENLGVFIF